MKKRMAYLVTISGGRHAGRGRPGKASCYPALTAVFLEQPGTGHMIEAFPDMHPVQQDVVRKGYGFQVTRIAVLGLEDDGGE